jgi:hypothetical protein
MYSKMYVDVQQAGVERELGRGLSGVGRERDSKRVRVLG